MLKAVSSTTNAIGALNYKGTWNANTNSPVLASGVGTKGDYYVVGTAGTTTLDGISNWGIGDWAVFNGSVWQRVEGGADLNGVNLSVSGTSTLGGNVNMTTGNLVVGTAGKGIDFSADPSAPGMTSELLDDYEEGTFTPTVVGSTSAGTANYLYGTTARYTKIGRVVYVEIWLAWDTGTGTGNLNIGGLPFAQSGVLPVPGISIGYLNNFASGWTAGATPCGIVNVSQIELKQMPSGGGGVTGIPYSAFGDLFISAFYSV